MYANCSGAKPLAQKEIDALVPDPHARTNSINFLLAAVCRTLIPCVFMLSALMQGLLKLMRDPNGNLSYRAVQKNELEAYGMLFVSCVLFPYFCHRKKGLSGEESMVLGHIQVAANQGDHHEFLLPTRQLSSR